MKHDPKLRLVATLTSARTYRFHATAPHIEWALCTVNDATGELLICSDWGNWTHRWNPKHLGSPSLTHFIADRQGYDYLANKLLDRDDAWVLDTDATIAQWRRTLAEARLREGRRRGYHDGREPLTADLAREIWDALGSLHDDAQHEPIFIEHACQIDGFSYWISERPWDETAHRHSHTYQVLVDVILPALAAACAETVESQAA
jgi:hypothetical protein